jgi:hypothetical protein
VIKDLGTQMAFVPFFCEITTLGALDSFELLLSFSLL